jgi:hypothetical protein
MMMRLSLTSREVIGLIIGLLNQDGEDKTDGEVLDEIWLTLEYHGYDVKMSSHNGEGRTV